MTTGSGDADGAQVSVPDDRSRPPVPVRTILATIGLVITAAVALYLVVETRRVLTWMVIAAFFAVALHPLAAWVQRRVLGGRRPALATFLVFLVVLLALAGLVTALVVPLVDQGTKFAGQFPDLIDDARAGQGPVGRFLERSNVLQWVQDNQDRIDAFVNGLTAPAAGVLRSVATGIAGAVTVFVLAYLMVLEGPKAVDVAIGVFAPATGDRIRRVAADCARSVTGYISGNLLISLICGVLTYVVLLILGVPFAALIALFVGIADLVPLVGATLGGAVAVIAGFLHSGTAGIVVLVFVVLYQQLENHVLQPLIFSRTVKLNPLSVIIAILLGVELLGVLGALLAIPVAGMVQVVLRDVWDHRRGELKGEPTVGEDRLPVAAAGPDRVVGGGPAGT
jgi:predicted PurR-regulated permease PerM